MRRPIALFVGVALALAFAASALGDVKITDHAYTRHDGGTDAAIAACSDFGTGTTAGGHRQQNEPAVAIDPLEPSFVVAASNDYCTVPVFADAWEGVYTSNGGATWTDSLLPGYPVDTSPEGQASPLYKRDTAAGDPILDWDNQNHLFVGGIAFNRTVTTGATFRTNANVYAATYTRDPSAPTGIKYLRTVIVGPGTPSAFFEGRFNDKPSLKVDDWSTLTSPFAGNVYMSWTLFPGVGQDQILFSRSTDAGQTFSKPIIISKNVPNAQGSDIAVTPNGNVYVVWRQFGFLGAKDDAIMFVKSTDGGKTFSNPAPVVDPIVGYDRADQYVTDGSARDCGSLSFLCVSGFTFHREDSLPQATADQNGNVYATWEQVSPVASNGDTYVPDGQSQIVVSKSVDGGANWTPATTVDPQASGHQWWPNLEFDQTTNTLVLAYFDSREDTSYSPYRPPGNLAGGTSVCGAPIGSVVCDVLNTFVATSTDGAATWTSTKFSSVGHQPEYEMFGGRTVPFHGDYIWVDADGGNVFAVWTDNRDVVPGADPRESPGDGFDVLQCRVQQPDGSFGPDTCPNAGGLNQNIYGGSP